MIRKTTVSTTLKIVTLDYKNKTLIETRFQILVLDYICKFQFHITLKCFKQRSIIVLNYEYKSLFHECKMFYCTTYKNDFQIHTKKML